MKTTLYSRHQALNAHFIDFGGWEMPLQYTGIIEEHKAVRNRVGIFDVSHMGRISIEGAQAEQFVDYISTNNLLDKFNFSATYTTLADSKGMTVDDTIIYRIHKNHFFLIVNAANRQKDLTHLEHYAQNFDVSIIPKFHDEGILAIQGPESPALMATLFPESQQLDKQMYFMEFKYQGIPCLISTTGYTGEKGYEIYAPLAIIPLLWDLIIQHGASHGIMPIGLGARNTLRLEMGFALYGNELSDSISPLESIANWNVKLTKPKFIGKEALSALKVSSNRRFAYGIVMQNSGIARDGYSLFQNDNKLGFVTSGGYSPSTDKSIALVLAQKQLKNDETVQVQIRGKLFDAKVIKIPFITH